MTRQHAAMPALAPQVERKKETDAGRLLWRVEYRRRHVYGLPVAIGLSIVVGLPVEIGLPVPIGSPMFMPVPPALAFAALAVPMTLTMTVMSGSDRRRDRQATYQRSRGEGHDDLAAAWPEAPGLPY